MANKHLKRYSTSISISKCRLQLRFTARRAPAPASDTKERGELAHGGQQLVCSCPHSQVSVLCLNRVHTCFPE